MKLSHALMTIGFGLSMSTPVLAQAARETARGASADQRDGDKESLCVVGRASDRTAPLARIETAPDPRELDAVAEALLGCQPQDMKANQDRSTRKPSVFAFGVDPHEMLPAGYV